MGLAFRIITGTGLFFAGQLDSSPFMPMLKSHSDFEL